MKSTDVIRRIVGNTLLG